MLLQADAVSQTLAENPDGLVEAFDAVTRVLISEVMPPLMDAGWNLYWGLAVLLVVWTGLKQAFSGDFVMWEFVRLIFALIIPLTMLQAYTTPLRLTATIPISLGGEALTFPELITAQGTWIANQVNSTGGGLSAFWDYAFSMVASVFAESVWGSATAPDFELWHVSAWAGWFFTATLMQIIVGVVFVLALLAAVVGFVQVIFGQVAIVVCTVFGPLLIPWLLLEPMAFLFWGWLRSMLMYGFYTAVAAAVFRVILAIQTGVTQRVLEEVRPAALLGGTSAEMQTALMDGLHWLLILVVASVASLLLCIKVPSIASGLVSGSASDVGVGTALGATAAVATAGVSKIAALKK